MKVKITPFKSSGEIVAPPSKSYAHRYIIAAFLSGKPCVILNAGKSADVNATIFALKSLGGIIERKDDAVYFKGKNEIDRATVDCAESGSTLRFLMPVAAALGIRSQFTGSERLLSRPIEDIARAIEGHGAKITGHRVEGKLKSGVYRLNAGVSSQFVSGLLFALSVLCGESEIVLEGDGVSKGYVDITVSVLKEFGVKVDKTDAGYRIIGGYDNPPSSVTVEGDWSGSAFPLCVGALCGSATVKNLKYPTLQPDGAIVDILRAFGAEVIVGENFVTAKRGTLVSVKEINCENFPDIAQVISSVAAFCNGETTLTGVNRLKIKESDRIRAITDTLFSSGITAKYDGERIIVFGGKPKGGEFSGGGDHRTVMSAAVIAAAAEGVSNICGAEHIAKSYPDFFNDLKILGGKVDVGI
ncbi:MAG: 3-phosphoshikimate 1-carboxyvinyltransferase [Clostridia bacterium]|nr:3-phosphoshikimate 1-carboxyvinyltransferase [Clostridia bacterium]